MMYGSAHLDTQLHDPWPVPDNIGPNHCPVGCSILLNASPPPDHGSGIGGQIGRGFQAVKRRFSNSAHSGIPGVSTGAIGGPADFGPGYAGAQVQGSLGKGRSSSMGGGGGGGAGTGSPVKEKSGWLGSSNPFSHSYVGSSNSGTGGGKGSGDDGGGGGVSAIFGDLNPFSRDKPPQSKPGESKVSDSSTTDAEKSDDTLAASKSDSDSTHTNTLPSLGSLGSVGRRESAIRFGTCPSRPPELRRQSSITLGVAARRGLLMEGNDASYGRNNSPGVKHASDGSASGSIQPPRRNSASPTSPTTRTTTEAGKESGKGDDIDAKFKAYQQGAPKDHSEADVRPIKSFWHKVLHPSDSHHPQPAPPGSLTDSPTSRRASAPVLATRQNMYKSCPSPISPSTPTNPTSSTSPSSPSLAPSSLIGAQGSPTTPSSAIMPGQTSMLEVLPEHEGERDKTPTGSMPSTPRGSSSRLAALSSPSPKNGSSERLNDQVKGVRLSEIYGRPGSPGSLGFEGVVPRGRASSASSGSGNGTGGSGSGDANGSADGSLKGQQTTSAAQITSSAAYERRQAGAKSVPGQQLERHGDSRAVQRGSYAEWSHSPSQQHHPHQPKSPLSASSSTMPNIDRSTQQEEQNLGQAHIKLANEPKPAGHRQQAEGLNATLRHPDPSLRAPSPPPSAHSRSSGESADPDTAAAIEDEQSVAGQGASGYPASAIKDNSSVDDKQTEGGGAASQTAGTVQAPHRDPIRRRASDASPASPMGANRAGERSHAVLGFHARLANVGRGASGF